MTLMAFLFGLALGFAAGVLFGRRNVKKVEAAVAAAKKEYERLEAEIKEKFKKDDKT